MGFVHFNEKHQLVGKDGKPFYLVGTNFAGGYTCSDFWADWRPERLLRDLDIMRDMGLNGIRIPIMWGTVEPEEGHYDETILNRIGQFFAWCGERGLYVMPWCLVGIATMTYDIPWRRGRSIFSDPSMVRAEERHLTMLGERFKDCENLLCWDICDEPEWVSRIQPGNDKLPYNTDNFTEWVGRMRNAFHKGDPNHLVTLGFGHLAVGRYGMDLRDCASNLDFMAVTAYADGHGGKVNTPRSGYELQYHMDMNRRNGPCYFCEAPGWSHTEWGEKTLAHYYNTCMYSGLLHHSCGVLSWVFCDFDEEACLAEDKPDTVDGANRHPTEPWFGMLDVNRRLRKCGQAMVDFQKEVKKQDITQYSFPKENTALIVPRGYHSTSWDDVGRMFAAHALISSSNLIPKMVWWDELDAKKTPLAILSAVVELSIKTEDWKRLCDYVENGGTLVMFRAGPSMYFHRMTGLWMDGEERYAPGGRLRAMRDFGPMKAGESIEFATAVDYRRGFEVDGAEVLATFEDGEPAITTFACGKGRTYVFASDIITHMNDCDEAVWHDSPLFGLLREMAEQAGILPEVVCDDPGIEVGILPGDEKDLLVAVNRNAKPVDAFISLRGSHKGELRLSMDGGEGKMIPLENAK